jgi:hypothetical protein
MPAKSKIKELPDKKKKKKRRKVKFTGHTSHI